MRGNPCLLDLYEMGRDRATFVIRNWMTDGIRVVGDLNKFRYYRIITLFP